MMRSAAVALILIFATFAASATHIVGGEFEIVHLGENRYLFRQIQYFDAINGNPDAEDASISASIFRMSDDAYVRNVLMFQVEDKLIKYSNPSCTDNTISTKRLVYETTLTLNPEDFDDPEGYYMVWERCCRNEVISNIVNPGNTGQTFYIEFPPLIKNGEPFVNSTPTLFPPLQDYACVNQFYYADFKGFDQDGDSLVYSLVTPLNSSETNTNPQPNPLPDPKPKPHSNINWAIGYSENVQVTGPEPLNITKDGILRVIPDREGLFVFSVKCEEFRNGEKIGEVRRDFQLFVVDCPPPGNKPEIKAKAPGSTEYKADISTVVLNYGDDTCFDIIVNDKDGGETIRIKAVPVNFQDSLQERLDFDFGLINDPNDTLKVKFCLSHCINDGSYSPAMIDLFVYDNRCPQSLIDTLRINAYINQPPNSDPVFTLPVKPDTTFALSEGGLYSIPVKATDADNDELSVSILPVDFDPLDYGLSLVEINNTPGEVDYNILWDADCEAYDFSDKNEFEFMLIVEDFDECLKVNADTTFYTVRIELPPNERPVLKLNGFESDLVTQIKIEELRNFIVTLEDADVTDSLSLTAKGFGFNLSDYGLVFNEIMGTQSIGQTFKFQVNCDYVGFVLPDTLEILFIGEDFDKCKAKSGDTLRLYVKLLPPDNNPPVITIDGSDKDNDTLEFIVGQNISLFFDSVDPDGDQTILYLLDEDSLNDNFGINFSTGTGGPSSSGTFSWYAECQYLAPGYKDGTYPLKLLAIDDKCLVPDSTFHNFVIVIKDKYHNKDFLPPNVFTPNEDDDLNPEFYIPNLPQDNCENVFEEIIILNRWGQEVFRSTDREFRWDGQGHTNGVYYYTLIFSNKSYKGIVSLLK